MAHSIQAYRGKTELINDLDLLIIIGFALEVMHQSTDFEGVRRLTQECRARAALSLRMVPAYLLATHGPANAGSVFSYRWNASAHGPPTFSAVLANREARCDATSLVLSDISCV